MQSKAIHQLIILYHFESIPHRHKFHKVNTFLHHLLKTTRQSLITMQFSTIAWIVTALIAGQTLATPAKKAGTYILGLCMFASVPHVSADRP